MKKTRHFIFVCMLMSSQSMAHDQYADLTWIKPLLTDIYRNTEDTRIQQDQLGAKLDQFGATLGQVLANQGQHDAKLDQVIAKLDQFGAMLGQFKARNSLLVKAFTEYNASKATFLLDAVLRSCTGYSQTYTGPVSIFLTAGCAVYKKLVFDPWVESDSFFGSTVGPYVLSKSWEDLGQEYACMIGFYCLTQPQVRNIFCQQGKKWVLDPITNSLTSFFGKAKDLSFWGRGYAKEGHEESDEEKAFSASLEHAVPQRRAKKPLNNQEGFALESRENAQNNQVQQQNEYALFQGPYGTSKLREETHSLMREQDAQYQGCKRIIRHSKAAENQPSS